MTDLVSDTHMLEILHAGLAQHKAPGASLAIFHGGKLTCAAAGVLNVDTGHPATPQSMFQIGSITKVFTATLVMQLVDDRLLELDRPVIDYLPDFQCGDRDARGRITARQLLNHTSGFGGDFLTDTGPGEDAVRRYLDRCALLGQSHAPGEALSYSNTGSVLAGRIVEVLRGHSWDQEVRSRIFDPLGMRRAATRATELVGHPVAMGHSMDPNGGDPTVQPGNYMLPMSMAPAGATATMSAADLVTFARAHLEGAGASPFLSDATRAAMQQRTFELPVAMRDITGWGLGWFHADWSGAGLFGHDGGAPGQAAFLRIHPASGMVAALLINGAGAGTSDLMDTVFAEVVEPLVGSKMPAPPIPSGRPVEMPERYEGLYRTVATETRISCREGRLYRNHRLFLDQHVIPEPEIELEHVEGDHFLTRRGGKRGLLVSFLNPDQDRRPLHIFTGLRLATRVET